MRCWCVCVCYMRRSGRVPAPAWTQRMVKAQCYDSPPYCLETGSPTECRWEEHVGSTYLFSSVPELQAQAVCLALYIRTQVPMSKYLVTGLRFPSIRWYNLFTVKQVFLAPFTHVSRPILFLKTESFPYFLFNFIYLFSLFSYALLQRLEGWRRPQLICCGTRLKYTLFLN